MIDERKMEACIKEVVAEYGVAWDSSREYQVSVDVWKLGYNKVEHLTISEDGYISVLTSDNDTWEDVANLSYSARLRINNIALDYYINTNEHKRANGPVS